MNAVYDFFINEFYFSIPLVTMSLIAAALVIWRFLLNLSANTDMDDFLPVFQQTLRKNGIKAAVGLCKEEKGLIPSRLFTAGLEAADQGAAAMRRSMANENELEVIPRPALLARPDPRDRQDRHHGRAVLHRHLDDQHVRRDRPGGATTGKAKDIGGHASKIGLALFATALGLFTAIPLVFSHVLFKEWIGRFENKAKSSTQKLITLVTNYKKDPSLLDEKEEEEDERDEDEERDEDVTNCRSEGQEEGEAHE